MIFNTKALSLAAAFLMVSTASSWGQGVGSEGLSRQVVALKTALESYSAVMGTRVAAIESNVTTLRTEVDAFNNCADRGMIYSPTRAPNSEGNCMSVSSAGVLEVIPNSEIIDTDRHYNISYQEPQSYTPKHIPADIFQVLNIDTISSAVLKTRTHTFQFRRDVDKEWSSGNTVNVTIESYIRVDDTWVPVGDGGTVTMDRNTNLTNVKGAIYQGLWTGEIANIPNLSVRSRPPVRPEVTKTH
ncbi:MAG: hypothetical protein VX730_07115 [Pseudomonadota bacterium]|nr:hypothetical protein [Pseudomonadota bacterium]